MTTGIANCLTCEYYEGDRHCEAFGNKEIPEKIYLGENDHKKPFPGDHGIQFKKRVFPPL